MIRLSFSIVCFCWYYALNVLCYSYYTYNFCPVYGSPYRSELWLVVLCFVCIHLLRAGMQFRKNVLNEATKAWVLVCFGHSSIESWTSLGFCPSKGKTRVRILNLSSKAWTSVFSDIPEIINKILYNCAFVWTVSVTFIRFSKRFLA